MDKRAAEWLVSGDTGQSSITILAWMNGARSGHIYYPLDPDDLGRCIRLINLVPEYREQLPDMAKASPEWEALVNHWDELEALYNEELPSRRAPKCYARMRALLEEPEQKRRAFNLSIGKLDVRITENLARKESE